MSVVDCDLHDQLPSFGALVPYLDEVWHAYRPQVPRLPLQSPGGRVNTDAFPGAVPAGSSPSDEGGGSALRSDVLDAHGIAMAVCTPSSYPGTATTQTEYHAALTGAYNDWMLDEWLAADDRLHASIQVSLQDIVSAEAEIERLGGNPRVLQVVLPLITDEGLGLKRYRPIFDAAARHDLVVALHPADVTRTATGFTSSYAEWRVGTAQASMSQLMNVIVSGVFDEHPNLRLLVLESGFLWLPYLMWTMDTNYKALRAEVPWLKRLPSEYVLDHVYVGCHPAPTTGPDDVTRTIEMSGSDGWLVFASDHPNPGFTLPNDLDDDAWPRDIRRKVLEENPAALYAARLERTRAYAS